MNTVSIVKCKSYDEKEINTAVSQIFTHLGGASKFIKKDNLVVIKPNLLKASLPEENIVTHPKLIEAVVIKVLEAGGRPMICDSVAFGSVAISAKTAGLDVIAKKYNVPIKEFNNPVRLPIITKVTPFGLVLDKLALEADVLINIPKLKAHGQLLLTAAVKNLFGCVPGKRKAFAHFTCSGNLNSFSEMILKIYQKLKSSLTIVDSVYCLESEGPASGVSKNLGLVVGGTDALSVDMVLLKILGIDPLKYEITKTAIKNNLAAGDYSKITILGENIEDIKDLSFKLPHKLDSITFNIPRIIKSMLKHFWMRYVART